MDQFNDVLVVMAKAPVVGAVKTRLAAAVGPARACALYRAFLCDLAARFGERSYAFVWAVHPAGAHLDPIVGRALPHLDQRGPDLGARMRHAFADLFAAGARRIVMLGADAPHLQEATIDAAFAALADHDVVLVPVRDGGYCLIGLRAPHDAILTEVAMGTDRVLEQTRARAAALGLRLRVLDATFDVDEWRDVEALAGLLARGEVALPASAAVLDAWQCGKMRR
jgi:hypothetical protein